MIDTSQYKRLAKHLHRTRKTLWEACRELEFEMDDIEDEILEAHTQECAHCGIWGSDHRQDSDEFPICSLCYRLVGH